MLNFLESQKSMDCTITKILTKKALKQPCHLLSDAPMLNKHLISQDKKNHENLHISSLSIKSTNFGGSHKTFNAYRNTNIQTYTLFQK